MPCSEGCAAAATRPGEEMAAKIKRVRIHIVKKGNDVTESEKKVFRALGGSRQFHSQSVS